ncbi:MAG: exodeoxyribonuclease III [Gammaproteobacteria bacterium]|nr:exodeoxyribonuclease III [Gammaproteobacteria bacterium]
MKVISFNLNGIRSAGRKGVFAWLGEQDADVICVQETKAQVANLDLIDYELPGYYHYFTDAEKKGYSGVGIYTKIKPIEVTHTLGYPIADMEGRFIQADYNNCRIVSLYLPSGTSGDQRQAVKMSMLDYFYQHYLQPGIKYKMPVIICGDWNIAHKPIDLKNWRQNQKNSGFLPQERAWLDMVFTETGWVDAFRVVEPAPDQYTWWSFRGQARAKNVGWRIDYQVVSPKMQPCIRSAWVSPEPFFSDHAPLSIDYDFLLE